MKKIILLIGAVVAIVWASFGEATNTGQIQIYDTDNWSTNSWPPMTNKIPKYYRLNVAKINTIEDVRAVLKGLDIRVSDNWDGYEDMKPYLEAEPVK